MKLLMVLGVLIISGLAYFIYRIKHDESDDEMFDRLKKTDVDLGK